MAAGSATQNNIIIEYADTALSSSTLTHTRTRARARRSRLLIRGRRTHSCRRPLAASSPDVPSLPADAFVQYACVRAAWVNYKSARTHTNGAGCHRHYCRFLTAPLPPTLHPAPFVPRRDSPANGFGKPSAAPAVATPDVLNASAPRPRQRTARHLPGVPTPAYMYDMVAGGPEARAFLKIIPGSATGGPAADRRRYLWGTYRRRQRDFPASARARHRAFSTAFRRATAHSAAVRNFTLYKRNGSNGPDTVRTPP